MALTTFNEDMEIISKLSTYPNDTDGLTPEELNLVFDYMTQHHQISSLEQVFAVQPKPKAEPAKEAPTPEAKKPEPVKAEKPKSQNPAKPQPAAQQPATGRISSRS